MSKYRYMTLWHVSPSVNTSSIFERGILPINGGKCWLVRWHGIAWAISHTSIRHSTPAWELTVFKVHVRADRFRHFRLDLWTADRACPVKFSMPASEALRKIEAQWGYIHR